MKFEKCFNFSIKIYKAIIRIVHDFYLNVNLNNYFFDVFDINKSFK